jgi:hypothetical protein
MESAESFPSSVDWGFAAPLLGLVTGRLDGSSNALMESAMRLVFVSTLSTITLTICPVFTASDGSLMNWPTRSFVPGRLLV